MPADQTSNGRASWIFNEYQVFATLFFFGWSDATIDRSVVPPATPNNKKKASNRDPNKPKKPLSGQKFCYFLLLTLFSAYLIYMLEHRDHSRGSKGLTAQQGLFDIYRRWQALSAQDKTVDLLDLRVSQEIHRDFFLLSSTTSNVRRISKVILMLKWQVMFQWAQRVWLPCPLSQKTRLFYLKKIIRQSDSQINSCSRASP